MVVQVSSHRQLVGDFDGDGRDDVARFADGRWDVSRSLIGAQQCQFVDIKTVDVAELPRACVDTPVAPNVGRAPIVVNAGDDLQAAIDRAVPGDVIELQAGATFRGRFRFGPKDGDDWIHVRSSRHAELPPAGTRIDPAVHAQLMPKIVGSGVESAGRAIDILAGAHHFRFEGIEVTSDYARTDAVANNLIVLNAYGVQDVSELPHHISFEHMFVHGNSTGTVLNGIRMDGRHVAVVDSYFAEFRAIGRESHAVYAADGAGPIKIVNNHLEAAGVTVLFGGDDPEIHGLVNSDIEIRDNLIRKSEATRTGPFVHKFLLEFKNAKRVLATGNILENAWADGRFSEGTALLIKATNQEGACTWCVAADVTFAHNIIRQASIGVKISGHVAGVSERTERVVIENNLIYNEDPSRPELGKTVPFVLLEDYDDVHIINNTTVTEGKAVMQLNSNLGELNGLHLVVRDNLLSYNTYGVKGNGLNSGKESLDAWVDEYVFDRNVLVGRHANDSTVYPDGTLFAPTVHFADPSRGDYRLAEDNPFPTDIGVDVERLTRAYCAENGQCGAFDRERWGAWSPNAPWVDVYAADVNGDGRDDIVGRSNGEWWVAKSTNQGFVNEHWTSWPGTAAWVDVQIADMNGDGMDDVVGRAAGRWWMAKSTGENFANEYMDSWSEEVVWRDVLTADIDGNGKDEILGRADGQWWTLKWSADGVVTEPWAAWSNSVDWQDVNVADVNGDSSLDIVGRADGVWWVSGLQEDGGLFTQQWGSWSPSVNWQYVHVADVNGDGRDDFLGQADGVWWANVSQQTTSISVSLGTRLPESLQGVLTADVNDGGLFPLF